MAWDLDETRGNTNCVHGQGEDLRKGEEKEDLREVRR
jgi:hypothetical protein